MADLTDYYNLIKSSNRKILEIENDFIIFGATDHGLVALDFLESNNRLVKSFWDNDKEKQGTSLSNIAVEEPNTAVDMDKLAVVIVSSKHYQSIYEQVLKLGINNIYIFFENFKKLPGMEVFLSGVDGYRDDLPLLMSYNRFLDFYSEIKRVFRQQLMDFHNNYQESVKVLKEKAHRGKKIQIAFFVTHSSVWKYDYLDQLFKTDHRFAEPTVVICPVINYGRENMKSEMDKTYRLFRDKGYNTIRTYEEVGNEYIDIRKILDPDIIFYTNPYKGLIHDNYYIDNFTDKLTIYVNYGYDASINGKKVYQLPLPNLVWRFFFENEMIYKIYKEGSLVKGVNGLVTGFPGIDKLIYRREVSNNRIKRIIWAPHHTIEEKGVLHYSNFLSYYKSFFDIAEKYKDLIHITFKPHPLLKIKLYNHSDWGQVRTDEYYTKWQNGINTGLNTDDYIELFNSSDALIHDCGSFTAEYLYSGKPVLYMMKESTYDEYNDFGKLALDCHYHSFNIEDVEDFIKNVVINGNDSMKGKRTDFYERIIKVKNKSGSENIYDHICQSIFAEEK